jgi:hypothetical protein
VCPLEKTKQQNKTTKHKKKQKTQKTKKQQKTRRFTKLFEIHYETNISSSS